LTDCNSEFFSNLVKDLIDADNSMSLDELYTHCKIISEHNGISETELQKEWSGLVRSLQSLGFGQRSQTK